MGDRRISYLKDVCDWTVDCSVGCATCPEHLTRRKAQAARWMFAQRVASHSSSNRPARSCDAEVRLAVCVGSPKGSQDMNDNMKICVAVTAAILGLTAPVAALAGPGNCYLRADTGYSWSTNPDASATHVFVSGPVTESTLEQYLVRRGRVRMLLAPTRRCRIDQGRTGRGHDVRPERRGHAGLPWQARLPWRAAEPSVPLGSGVHRRDHRDLDEQPLLRLSLLPWPELPISARGSARRSTIWIRSPSTMPPSSISCRRSVRRTLHGSSWPASAGRLETDCCSTLAIAMSTWETSVRLPRDRPRLQPGAPDVARGQDRAQDTALAPISRLGG